MASRREVWGVMKNDPNVPAHLVVVYDLRVKQYRRFDITKPFNVRSGGDFIAAGLWLIRWLIKITKLPDERCVFQLQLGDRDEIITSKEYRYGFNR
jgi:hypothetical protein